MTIEQGSLTAEPLPITVDRALFFAVHDVSTGAAVPRAGDRPEGVIRPVREVQPGPGPIAALHGADLPVRDQTEVGERIVTEHPRRHRQPKSPPRMLATGMSETDRSSPGSGGLVRMVESCGVVRSRS